MTAYVLLEDGTRFDGDAVGAPGPVTGEVVFTTGMSGYQESMSDPSFARQLITFTAPMVGNYGVSAAAMESDRQALIDALRSGVIDCIATDHAPHARDEKEVPFEQAPMGTTGLETAFAAVHTELVLPGVLSLALVVERLTAGAALLDLPAPRIATGEPANLTLVDLAAEWEVGEDGYESRSENCCFAGRRLRGRVLLTVAGGTVAYRERALVAVGA